MLFLEEAQGCERVIIKGWLFTSHLPGTQGGVRGAGAGTQRPAPSSSPAVRPLRGPGAELEAGGLESHARGAGSSGGAGGGGGRQGERNTARGKQCFPPGIV